MGVPCGVVTKVLGFHIVVTYFKLQSRDYILFYGVSTLFGSFNTESNFKQFSLVLE